MANVKQFIGNDDVKHQIKKLRVLNEWVDRNTVADAIKNRDVVFIYYAGDDTVNKGYRTVEPFVLGRSKTGNLVVRAWQQGGATDSGNNPVRKNDEIPGWRLFRLDGITQMSKTLRKFDNDPSYLASNRPNYNPKDSQMSQIYIAVEPGGSADTVVSGNTSITKPDVVAKQQPDNFFKTQADKFKNFFKKPDMSTSWIENQKRQFKELIKRKNQENDGTES